MILDTLAPFLVPVSYIGENYSWRNQGWMVPYRSPIGLLPQEKLTVTTPPLGHVSPVCS